MKGRVILVSFIIVISLWAWQKNGSPVCQAEGGQSQIKAVALSGGRVAVSWLDTRSDTHKIYLQVINSTGTSLFKKDGIRASQREGGEFNHNIATDGSDIFVVYEGGPLPKARDNLDIFLDRIDGSTGENVWGDIRVCGAEGQQYTPQLCLSGEGEDFGAWICWTDYRDYETTGPEVRVARVTEEGEVAFEKKVGDGGLRGIIPSLDGDAIIIGGGGLVQKISPLGEFKWTFILPEYMGCEQVISDDNGGIIFLGRGRWDINPGLRVWRIDAEGKVRWDSLGVFIRGWGYFHQTRLSNGAYGFSEDGYGGCLVSTSLGDIPLEHWVYRVDSTGEKVWPDGIRIWTSDYWPGYRGVHAIVKDGSGGCISAWDTKSDSTEGDIWAARVDEAGALRWVIPTCEAPRTQEMRVITSIPGGAILCWEDMRNGNLDIYCQFVDTLGNIGIEEKSPYRPSALKLHSNPNPFVYQTSISYTISHPSQIELEIFDVSGRRVKVLDKGFKKAGNYKIRWDRRNDEGKVPPAGIYFCRLSLEGEKRAIINKMIVLDEKEVR